jgi:glycosyltransferase involved in cell wall biosynthesis
MHVQCFSANGAYATVLCKALGLPLVVSLQGETVMDDQNIYDHSLTLRAGLRAGLRTATAVTACSKYVLDDAERRFGLRPDVGIVVPNGVDVAESVRSEPLELPFSRFVLGLGRVVHKKGFDLLLEAFAAIAGDHADVGLVIGGDGPARVGLTARAVELGLGERVALSGVLSRGQVAWAMANATVFVLPSRVEPFGIVVLEALRAGRPVVASTRGGAREIVTHERDGLLVDPFDTHAMANAVARLLGDAQLCQRLGTAALARAGAFSWDDIGERYRRIYCASCDGA